MDPTTLQSSFLHKGDLIFSKEECSEFLRGIRLIYKDLYQYQRNKLLEANSINERFKINDQYLGKYSGIFGCVRSADGGLLFLEKSLSKYSNKYEINGAKAISFLWLRYEASIMKSILGEAVKFILYNPKYSVYLCEFTHDEIGFCIKENFAEDFATLILDMIVKICRDFIPDFEFDSLNPLDYIKNSWKEKS